MSSARAGSCDGRWIDVLFAALAYWYLTGAIALLGFSFGFHLARRTASNVPQTNDPVFALTWMDAGWYRSIATRGFEVNAHGQSNIAFFPAYPLLARGVMMLTGLRPELALSAASNSCWLAALVALAFYVRARFVSSPDGLADCAVLAAAVMPAGCFFRLNYSESTFLFFSVLAFNSMARGWPLGITALIMGLATAARPVGVALVAPLIIHILRGAGKDARLDETHPAWRMPRAKLLALAVYPAIACWGLWAFMAYQQHAFRDAFAAFKAHEHWRIQGQLPWPEKVAALATLAFSDRSARVVGGTSTCTCVTIEALPLDVAPRDSVDVPVTIRVSGDLGPFAQTVTLYVDSGDSVLQTLEAVVEANVGDDP